MRVCMYVCMQRSRDRVHACAARMRRCYVSAFRRALMRTFVPDTLSLCASSATRRLELEAALWLPLPSSQRGGEGEGEGVMANLVSGFFRIIRSFLNLYLNAKKNSSKNFSCFYIFINWISFPVRKDSLYALARQNR